MIGALTLVAAMAALSPPGDKIPLRLDRLGLSLTIDYQQGSVRGSATLLVANPSPRAVAEIPLLLNRLMVVSRVTDAKGRPVPYSQRTTIFSDDSTYQVAAIRIQPTGPIGPGDSLGFTVDYGGVLVGYTETGSLYIQDHVSPDFTILREDALAFPVLGVASWAANRAIVRENFEFTARITVPESLTVAAGGSLSGRERRDSLVTWTYRSTAPVPFLNITIAPYRILEDSSSRIFYFPADSAGARMMQGAIASALARFDQWYGHLGARPRLTVMEIPENFGSQASLTAGIIQTADAFRARMELRQVYHELSHLWNVPDLDRPSSRWNEGLASFLQWRMAGELDGWNDWDGQVARLSASLLERCAPPAPCGSTPMADFGATRLTDRSYGVGMLMFLALYRTMGSERFDRAYRKFFQQNQTSGGNLKALTEVFTAEDARSRRIFDEWMYSARWYNVLKAGGNFSEVIARY